tara:strand:+ start:142 stop:603 length:462 start_codon:yes stop_codon:yes gene_type:complete
MNKAVIVIISIVVLVLVFSIFRLYLQNIKIPELGHQNGVLTTLPKTPNAIGSQTPDHNKLVAPLNFKGNIIESREKLKVAAINIGDVDLMQEEENYLYFVFKSKNLKFKDDVEFYLDESDEVIHVRSSSRVGTSDMGVNLKRYEAIKQTYNEL